jgi:hypothetical protein
LEDIWRIRIRLELGGIGRVSTMLLIISLHIHVWHN